MNTSKYIEITGEAEYHLILRTVAGDSALLTRRMCGINKPGAVRQRTQRLTYENVILVLDELGLDTLLVTEDSVTYLYPENYNLLTVSRLSRGHSPQSRPDWASITDYGVVMLDWSNGWLGVLTLALSNLLPKRPHQRPEFASLFRELVKVTPNRKGVVRLDRGTEALRLNLIEYISTRHMTIEKGQLLNVLNDIRNELDTLIDGGVSNHLYNYVLIQLNAQLKNDTTYLGGIRG